MLPLDNPSVPGCPEKIKDKFAGSRFVSLGVGEGRSALKERKIQFAKLRAVGSQRENRVERQ